MGLKTYGVLLVSFSKHSHQNSFVTAFLDNPRIKIVGIADDDDVENELKLLNRKWADRLNVPYFEGISNAIQLREVDIVSIGHEIEKRADIAITAASYGKHLWIDKFIGANRSQCLSVVEAADNANIKTIIPSYAYNDLMNQNNMLINSGQLGELRAIHIDIFFGKGIPNPIPDENKNKPFLPPGRWKFPDIKREILTIGAYAVALVQINFGPITEVYGQGGAYFFKEHASHGADDFGTLTIIDNTGRVATISSGRTGIGSDGAGGPAQGFLFGTQGVGRIDGKRPGVASFMRENLTNYDYQVNPDDPMQWHSASPNFLVPTGLDFVKEALNDFIHALDTGGKPKFTVKDAQYHMNLLLSAYESILNGSPVTLDLNEEAC